MPQPSCPPLLRAAGSPHSGGTGHDRPTPVQQNVQASGGILDGTALGSHGVQPATRQPMIQQRRPSLRLLSLNVNGLRSASKRRSLFTLLRRDRWDVVLLQETHHTDEAEGQAWAEEGPHGLTANWSGPSFWSHGSAASKGCSSTIQSHCTHSRHLHPASVSRRPHTQHGFLLC